MKSIRELDKTRLLHDLRARVRSDLEALVRRQEDVRAGATHEESRSEHAKDTRATEQSYLARGLARRVEETRALDDALAALELRPFDPSCEAIALLALVSIRPDEETADGAVQILWLVPGPAGVDLSRSGLPIQTVTPAAPLGRALLGLQVGDEGRFRSPSGEQRFEVLEIA